MTKGKKRLQMQKRPKSQARPPATAEYDRLAAKYEPGTPKSVQMDVSGTEDEWEARNFHAWLNGRDIPIEELCLLFNRDEATIRRWLAMAG